MDQSLWKVTKRVVRILPSSPTLKMPRGLAFSGSDKAEVLADSLEAQFQRKNNPSETAVIEMVNEAMRSYEYAPQVSEN
jgi:hypothetical protein